MPERLSCRIYRIIATHRPDFQIRLADSRTAQAVAFALAFSLPLLGAEAGPVSIVPPAVSLAPAWRRPLLIADPHSEVTTITITGAAGPSETGVWNNIILEGAATSATDLLLAGGYVMPQNYFGCADEVTAAPISGNPNDVPCLVIADTIGPYAMGSRSGLWVDERIVGDTSAVAGNDYYPVIASIVTASANVGGAPGLPLGNIYGVAAEVVATGAASYYGTVSGGEFDVSAQAGSSPFRKTGLQIVAWNGDHDHGSVIDAGIELARSGDASGGGFNTGFLVGGPDQWPITPTGTIIGDGGNAATAAFGIDLHDVRFTEAAFYANGLMIASGLSSYSGTASFDVDQGGNGTMVAFAGSGSVNADHVLVTGAPSGGAPVVSVEGSDANSPLVLRGKGNLGVQIAGNNGLVVGNPIGGYEAAGSVNASAYFAEGAGGVTCSGTPSALFSAAAGIVTHC